MAFSVTIPTGSKRGPWPVVPSGVAPCVLHGAVVVEDAARAEVRQTRGPAGCRPAPGPLRRQVGPLRESVCPPSRKSVRSCRWQRPEWRCVRCALPTSSGATSRRRSSWRGSPGCCVRPGCWGSSDEGAPRGNVSRTSGATCGSPDGLRGIARMSGCIGWPSGFFGVPFAAGGFLPAVFFAVLFLLAETLVAGAFGSACDASDRATAGALPSGSCCPSTHGTCPQSCAGRAESRPAQAVVRGCRRPRGLSPRRSRTVWRTGTASAGCSCTCSGRRCRRSRRG